MAPRVLLDATSLPASRVGAGTYVAELLGALEPGEADLHVLAKRRDAVWLERHAPGAVVHPVRVSSRPARLLWEHTLLLRRERAIAPEVFHGPHYTLPSGLRSAGVVTFHDPTFFTHPHLHERSKVVYFTRAARAGVRRAARVVAVSDYARRGAIEHVAADPERVEVVPLGVDPSRYRPGPVEDHLLPGPREPFILFVGAIEPRKDVPTLVEAYARLAPRFPHALYLVGPPAWGTKAVEAAVARVDAGTVRRTGYVSEETKVALYRAADVFVYPSIAEGFGLPVLEAMACGAPVVTTTGSAPAEVAGDAAELVPSGDPAALAGAIERVFTDEELASSLRRKGPERARPFTWRSTAEATAGVWRRAAAERP